MSEIIEVRKGVRYHRLGWVERIREGELYLSMRYIVRVTENGYGSL